MSQESVKTPLRDGKFYADPTTDPARLQVARSAADAKQRGQTRAQFGAEQGLSVQKAQEAWRDADIAFGAPDTRRPP